MKIVMNFLEQHPVVQHPENVCNLQKDLLFLPERMRIETVKKLIANWHDKKYYAIHIRDLKQALNHGLVMKKVQIVIKFD